MFYNDNDKMFYDGDKLDKFLNLINYIIFNKKIKVPLQCHHGTIIRLNKYKIKLTILNSTWTHANKGNGKNHVRFIFSDETYYHTLNERGQTVHSDGLMLNEQFRLGIEQIFRGYDCKFQHCKNSIFVDFNQEVEFVATIKYLKDSKVIGFNETENELYGETYRTFVETIRESFLIAKTLN
jgi:hypothetical protein